MTEREKQIEEMVQDIAYNCADMAYNSCGDKTCCGCLAKSLVEQGYRKIDENEIVISKEEYEKITKELVTEQRAKEIAQEFFGIVRKETAEKFYNLSEELGGGIAYWHQSRKLAKEFGVDLGEDDET